MSSTDHADPARIVGVQYLNARPLLAGLEAGIAAPFSYAFSTAEPAVCADSLAAGSAVAGLVPVASLPHLTAVHALPGLGIAARGAVLSVLLWVPSFIALIFARRVINGGSFARGFGG